MKTDSNKEQHNETLARYLCGEMSPEESRLFETEIAVIEDDQTSMENLKEQWSALKGYGAPKLPDTPMAWDRLHKRLVDENLVPAEPASLKIRNRTGFLKIAAAIVFVLGTIALIYININRKPAVEMVRLDTGNGENTLVKTLADGSVIYIAQNSFFSFPGEFKTGSRNVELKGEAFFDIAADPLKPFIIETDEAIIRVLGTAFNVSTNNGHGFELIVDRGTVKVTLKADPANSETVVAGEKIAAGQNGLVKTKNASGDATSWYKRRLNFKDESLQNIISVLNRNFNTNFALADPETGKHKLTVTFDNETAETMNELICVALNLKSQTIHGSVVFSENRERAKPD